MQESQNNFTIRWAVLLVINFLILIAIYGFLNRFEDDYFKNIRYIVHVGILISFIALLCIHSFFNFKNSHPKIFNGALFILVTVASLSWSNWGRFHGNSYYHYWELTHYNLGAKYFKELGYDDLYLAIVAAEKVRTPEITPKKIRNLKTNEIVLIRTIDSKIEQIPTKFTPERWNDFVKDWTFFRSKLNDKRFERLLLDHGYNPPPTWTLTTNIVLSGISIFTNRTDVIVKASAWIDVGIYLFIFTSIYFVFGKLTGIAAIVFFCANPFAIVDYTTGALLRQDWLLMIIMACISLKKRWLIWAGIFIGIGTSLRIFPLLLMIFPAFQFLYILMKEKKISIPHIKFGGSVIVTALILFSISIALYGKENWISFANNIQEHNKGVYTNHVAIRNLFLYEPESTGTAYSSMSGKYHEYWREYKEQRLTEFVPTYLALVFLWMFVSFRVFRKSSLLELVSIGSFLSFYISYPANYYLMYLMPILFLGNRESINRFLIFWVCLYMNIIHVFIPNTENYFSIVSYAICSLSLMMIFTHFTSLKTRKPINNLC
ncbi:DUF2029 domain-containing protein [Bacteriovoracaceae bacterium]|nr:DUF2029 domain-containing protein [Bacteriovoracaceae bacterium]